MSAGSSQSSDETSPRLRDLDLDDEHAYQHGHHAIPMQSPGDLDAELIMEPLGVRRQRGLSRLRRRVFFHGEDGSSSDPQRQHRRRILERITLRRRKQGEGDAFWTAILISSLFFFALMCYMSVYLTQTDVFAAHQGDLFGTTVDNRFTVVSQENERAVITLKSGYSNSRFSEAMVAFSEGELRMGRRALAPTDTQSFYGLSIFNNGSAAFTNRLSAPFVKTEYVHASKAIVFEDGTVMTTAANISGGVKEVGDLNVVSQTGAVSLSAGGKPVVVVNPDGTVSMQRTGSDRPGAMGITLDGAAGRMSIGESFRVDGGEDENILPSLTTVKGLHVNTTRIVIGSSLSDANAGRVTPSLEEGMWLSAEEMELPPGVK
ncbi:hypothetical protein P43SY_008925 [Pythium insidiosum]|uniref:Uncharacterized protein n=1 Tax=Pythium insidiosum TaxID=114742 RepID=A0AAD5LFT3_PYTIN|nr:hypothetical protein P43SY_008925 [Pythium insidiosum]